MSLPPSLFKRVFLPVVLLFVLTALLVRMALDSSFDAGLMSFGRQAGGMFNPQFLKQWWRVGRVMEQAHQNYLQSDKVTYDKLANSALDHVLDGLDRYSTYMQPIDYEDFTRESAGRYVGVGVEIERRNGRIQIMRVFPGSPAERAGWQPGDRLVKIGETDVHEFTVPAVAELLRGAEGTTVQVARERPGEGALAGPLKRSGFDIPSVRDIELRPDGVGYLRLTQFGENTGKEFSTAVQKLMGEHMRGLVLDMRDNPGGLVDAAVEVLEPLLPSRKIVVSMRGRNGHPDEVLLTEGKGEVHYTGPVVVLMNDMSASAAEIVAGALQDSRRAVIVGERSYGKGIVQTVSPLPDGGGLRLTTEAYFLPSGRTIQDTGITPDIPMAQSAETHDFERLQRSDLRLFKPEENAAKKTNPDKVAAEKFTTSFGFAPLADPQVETAAGVIRALPLNFTK